MNETQPQTSPSSIQHLRFQEPGARVLLAEDDESMRDMVASSLREDGYDVVAVGDGGEVLLQLVAQTDAFDVVVCDVRMPVFSGMQIVEAMRRAQWTTPIILMTAFGDRDTHDRADELGAILFDKPFDLDDLRTAVLHVLRGSVAKAGDAVLELVASRDSGLDAWSIKWLLLSERIPVFLGGRAMASSLNKTDVYVLRSDASRARELIRRLG